MEYKRCKFLKQITCLIMVVVLTMMSLTACEFRQQETQLMSFEFTLSDQDVADTLACAKQLEKYIEGGKHFKIISVAEQLQEKRDYIFHQYLVSEVKYYSDLEDENNYEKYVFADEAHMTVREESLRVLKTLYQSDLKAKERVFADWTDEQIKTLEVSNEDVIALEKEQNELMREYLALDDLESEAWSVAMEDIYFRFVDSAQQIASYYGYDNYYDYAAREIYMREYTKEQREAFRKNVKEQILPFYIEIDSRYQEKRGQLTEAQEAQLSSLRKDVCLKTNEYLAGYIDSYPDEMKTIMNNLFDREAIVYSESENAYNVAYTNFSDYCDQPFVFLGNNCQNLLTLVHELGHYAAFYHFLDAELPYDTCEVHSQGNEWLIMQFLDEKIDQGVYEAFLLWRLRYGLDVMIHSTLVDEYEEAVYTCEKIADSKAFKSIMSSVLDDYDGIEQVETRDELYIYAQYVTIEAPVYYLSYATSELAAMSFYAVAEEKGYEYAQKIYMDLCLKTPTDQVFFDTLLNVGLPDPFDLDTVTMIKKAFETILAEGEALPAA